MEQMNERIAYLRGLAEGLDISKSSSEGRVLVEVIDVLDTLIRSIDDLEIHQEQVEDYVMAIDEDLSELETDYYDLTEDPTMNAQMDTNEVDEITYVQLNCPNCHETVYVDQSLYDEDEIVEVICPECNETILVNEDIPLGITSDYER